MDMRTKLMGHMVVGLLVDIGKIDLTRLEMAGCWTLRIGEVTCTYITLVLVLIGIIIVVVIILTIGVIGDTFHMSLRNQIHLPLMER